MKKKSQYYDMECVEFLDHINFKNVDFDDKLIDHMQKSI